VWKRNDSNEQLLSRMVANSSYLIRSTAAATRPRPRRAAAPPPRYRPLGEL
jgi:hypothetical protein